MNAEVQLTTEGLTQGSSWRIPSVRSFALRTLCLAVLCHPELHDRTRPVTPDQATRSANAPQKEATMTKHAQGTFEVNLTPQKPDNREAESANIGRMSIDKHFQGDLEAVSNGEMLSVMTEVQGSAGYVAIERVKGTLHGRKGSFVLQHRGTMARGVPQLSVTVVPDSGTEDLAGLSGTMNIKIETGKHSYEFEYTLPSEP